MTTHFAVASTDPPTSARHRFQAVVNHARQAHQEGKLRTSIDIELRRSSLVAKELTVRAPGIDVLHPPAYIVESHSRPVDIVITDFNNTNVSAKTLTNDTLEAFLAEPRPDHSTVRWINIEGLSFDVVKTLGVKYGLHPLAVEDVFHLPQRVKADFFEEHLYINLLMPVMMKPGTSNGCDDDLLSMLFKGHHNKLVKTAHLKPALLEKLERPDMYMEECSFFLLDHGILISIFPYSGRQITDRILEILFGVPPSLSSPSTPSLSTKLQPPVAQQCLQQLPLPQFVENLTKLANPQRLTLLRKSNDASFLLHSLMDGVVDSFFAVTEFYGEQIAFIQDAVLEKPKAGYTKTLHLIVKEINMMKRKFQPTEKMLLTLKQEQYQDCVIGANEKRISSLTRTYFGDVLDHCMTVLDEFAGVDQTAIALIDLTFNTIAHQTNESMKFLAVVSFVFLPITFVCGYYGMNFDQFPELHWDLGVNYFWIVAVVLIFASLVGSHRLGLLTNY
ncbi:UNVERIFIED_CONTAM: hypothetical protein HDU68_000834 [Siphonaria sp. JEL0065]|nr:hypothetical protein HDU68_000834 [Siphonaria sp. JEL0065]